MELSLPEVRAAALSRLEMNWNYSLVERQYEYAGSTIMTEKRKTRTADSVLRLTSQVCTMMKYIAARSLPRETI